MAADLQSAHRAFREGAGEMGGEATFNPAVSEKQRRMMGADLARARAGKKTRTGMSIEELRHFASK